MSAQTPPVSEPKPLPGLPAFEVGDFHALEAGLASDPQYNDRRLVTRRRILGLGKRIAKDAKALEEGGVALDVRSSLHQPHAFNGNRVRRIWSYLTRTKGEKRRLKGILGAELAKDLDSAYKNGFLCVAIESDALEVSLRIHPDAWYDGQNLKNRIAADGVRPWLDLLNRLDGFHLRMHDWKGEWRCGELTPEKLEEYLGYYTPGDHRLAVERRWPVPAAMREPALTPEVPETLVAETLRLLPLYRYSIWSAESDHLFASS